MHFGGFRSLRILAKICLVEPSGSGTLFVLRIWQAIAAEDSGTGWTR
jgi:hypothetical protein